MTIKKPLARAIRIAISGAAGLSAALTSTAVLSQDELQEVVITGSRIRQNPLEQRLPVLSVTEDEFRASGATSIADFVQRLPITGSAINRTNNASGNLGFPSDGGGIGAGASEVDLRYLTSKRVLVLVDGRRWIKGSSGSGVSGAVDLNSIPANAVKSIEILQDGASAIYGSDAIGGVVNIITQDDYDSFRITGYTGQYRQGDGETSEFDVRMGARSERGRAFLDVSYADQKAVNTADRTESVYPVYGSTLGASSGTPDGRFLFFDPVVGDFVDVTPNRDFAGPLPVYIQGDADVLDPNGVGQDDFHVFGAADLFNYQPYNHLVTPNERTNIFAKAEYDVTENVMFRALASFNNRKSQGRAAPVPLFFGVEGGLGFYMENYVWPEDHPFNVFGTELDGQTTGIFVTKRPVEAGPRIFNQDVDTWYVSGGFDGEFSVGGRDMYWDVTAIWSENNAQQTQLNQFDARKLSIAIGDPAVCAATPGCVPINIIGEGSLTPEMLDYVTYTGIDTSKQELTDVTANLSGELFDLPAGALAFAVGYEHREEDGNFIPNAIAVAGESADQPAQPTSGGITFDEFYGEVVVPIVADRPGVDSLTLSAAARYSDSDRFDAETGTKFALNWAPTGNLMLRASYAEGFRAPNIGELFNLGTRFDTAIADECDALTTPTVPVPANCAQLVPPGYQQLNPQISVTTGGNPDLQPETSETWTAGFTWDTGLDAGAIDQFLIDVNYYDISIDGAIQAPNAQATLDACIATLDPFFCDAVNRTANGTIARIDGILANIGGVETTGLDFNFDLGLDESRIGTFRFQLMGSLLFDYDELFPNAAGTFDRFERAGTELGNPSRGFIEEKITLNNFWTLGDWGAVLSFRYLSSLTEQCAGTISNLGLNNELCNGPLVDGVRTTNELDSLVYTDAQVSWSPQDLFGGGWTFAAGVNNLLDERPPACYSCDLNTLSGTIHQIAGQFWYLRASFQK